MGEVVYAPVITRLDLPPDRILDAAKDAGLTEAVVIGREADGRFYFASSVADGGSVLWLMEIAKKRLLEMEDE